MNNYRRLRTWNILTFLFTVLWMNTGIAEDNHVEGDSPTRTVDRFSGVTIVLAADKKPSWYKPKPAATKSNSNSTQKQVKSQPKKPQKSSTQQRRLYKPVSVLPKKVLKQPMVSAAAKLTQSVDKTGRSLARNVKRQYILKNIAAPKSKAVGDSRKQRLTAIKRKLRGNSSIVPGKKIVKTVQQRSTDALKSNQAKRKSNTTVLGRFPAYRNLSDAIHARRFNVPTKVYDKMSGSEKWTANKKYLDRMIAKKDKIVLATPAGLARNSAYANELNYLKSKGCTLNKYGTRMSPPTK